MKLRYKNFLPKDIDLLEIINGSLVSFMLRIIGLIVGYIFTIIISDNYGANTLGLFTLAVTILQILSLISRMGLDTAILKSIPSLIAKKQTEYINNTYKKFTYIIILLSSIMSVVLYINLEYLSIEIFHKPSVIPYLELVSFTILPYSLVYFHAEVFRSLQNIKLYTFFQNIGIFLLSVILLLGFQYLNIMGNNRVLFSYSISVLLLFFISIYYIIELLKKYPFKVSKYSYKMILKLSFPMFVSSSISLVVGWTDILMIGIFLKEDAVGLYIVAVKIATLATLSLVAINSIVTPKLSGYWAKDDFVNFTLTIKRATKMIFWTSVPFLIIIVIYKDTFLMYFGAEFIFAENALLYLVLGQFFSAVSGPVGQIMNMSNHEREFRNISLIIAVLNLVLNYILIPLYGINGAAIATAISLSLWNLICVLYLKYKLGFITMYLPFMKG